jgi:hypothetical protein
MRPGRKNEAGDTEWLPETPPQPAKTTAAKAREQPKTTDRHFLMAATIGRGGGQAIPD